MSHSAADTPTAPITRPREPAQPSKRISLSGRLPTDPPLLLLCWFEDAAGHRRDFGSVTRDSAVGEFDGIDFLAACVEQEARAAAGEPPAPVHFVIEAPQGARVRLECVPTDELTFTLVAERPVEDRVLGLFRRTRTEIATRTGLDELSARAVIKTAFDSVADLFR